METNGISISGNTSIYTQIYKIEIEHTHTHTHFSQLFVAERPTGMQITDTHMHEIKYKKKNKKMA